jgi:hypothetical protein
MFPDVDPESMAAYYLEQGMYYPDSDNNSDYERSERPVQCKFCKRDFLTWIQTSQGWRLSESDGSLHSCKEYKK